MSSLAPGSDMIHATVGLIASATCLELQRRFSTLEISSGVADEDDAMDGVGGRSEVMDSGSVACFN